MQQSIGYVYPAGGMRLLIRRGVCLPTYVDLEEVYLCEEITCTLLNQNYLLEKLNNEDFAIFGRGTRF